MEIFGIVILIVGCFGLGILNRYLRERKLTRMQEMIHLERMRAMEKGIPLPDLKHDEIVQELSNVCAAYQSNGGAGRGMIWLRVYALCLGLILFFGGLGTMAGLCLIVDDETRQFWALGFIPVLVGVGLLLFCLLTRGQADRTS